MNLKTKRTGILNAAEQVMSQKGLNKSSIAEIARLAGVKDSSIYQHFKGKEDLLFSIAEERMKEFILYLSEHLEGIEDPVSRLRKLIWCNLRYNDTHPKYARLLTMECRCSNQFYQHKAYSLIRQYAGTLLSILKDGVKKEIFRNDINMRLVRDMIFGLMDWEKISSLAVGEIEKTVTGLDDIMLLLLPAIINTKKVSGIEPDKASRILKAAEKMIAEKGFNNTTISEIAGQAEVAEGTVYEYFKNKEDLLLSIPQHQFARHMERLNEIFEIKTPMRKLRRLIRYYFYLHLTERDFLKVFLLNIQFNQKFYDSPVFDTFNQYIAFIINIIEEGKANNSIRQDVNNRVFRNLFLGAFTHLSLRWFILKDGEKLDKMKELDDIVDLLCAAITE